MRVGTICVVSPRWIAICAIVASLYEIDAARADTWRVTCQHVEGHRIVFFDNPVAPAANNKKVVEERDRIDGIRLEITFNDKTLDATLVTTGNTNVSGEVGNVTLVRVPSPQHVSFVGIDPDDGSVYLISYFPRLNKLLWSMHNDRIYVVDGGAVGKQYMADCVPSRVGN